MYIQCLYMSKQLIGQKEQGKMIVRMNGLVIGSDTSYTVSSQSGSWKFGRYRDMKTLSNGKLEVPMERGLKIHKIKTGSITTGFAIGFYERVMIFDV
jgi:hypothetical protein